MERACQLPHLSSEFFLRFSHGGDSISESFLLFAEVGIVLAVKGKKAAAAAGAPTGMATAGLVLAIIGTSLSVIGVIACGICVVCSASATKGIEDALGSGALDDLQNALDQIS